VPRLELLEDRLAPALGLFGAVFLTDPDLFPLPANLTPLAAGSTVSGETSVGQAVGYALVLPASGRLTLAVAPGAGGGTAPRVLLQESDGRVLFDSTGGTNSVLLLQPPRPETYRLTVEPTTATTGTFQLSTTFTPLLPMAGGENLPPLDEVHVDPGSHPILALWLASRSNGSAHGDGLFHFSPLNMSMASAPPPSGISAGQDSTSTMIVMPQNQTTDPTLHLRPPPSGPTRSDLAVPSNPAPPVDGPGFSPFIPSVLMSPGKDRPRTFELSPYAPSGPDIVPVPVPSGPADRLADLFGGPPRDAVPDNLLGEGRGSNDAVRDAISQMLRESWAPPGLLEMTPPSPRNEVGVSLPSPAPPEAIHSPSPDADSAIVAPAPPVSNASSAEEKTTTAEPRRRSMLAAVAAGLGFAGWRGWRRERRTRRFWGDPARPAPCP
jgi:hypothetical protein